MNFSNFVKSAALVGSSAFLIVGCGGGTSSTPVGYNGAFIDSPVQGISWSCGIKNGVTDGNGQFGECPAGSMVTFSIGNVELGTVAPTADYIFTPQDVVGVARTETSNTDVQDMAALLLTLDADGDPTNGIDITSAMVTAFNAVTAGSTTIADLNIGTVSLTNLVNDITQIDATLTTNVVVYTPSDATAHLIVTEAAIANGDYVVIQPTDGSTN